MCISICNFVAIWLEPSPSHTPVSGPLAIMRMIILFTFRVFFDFACQHEFSLCCAVIDVLLLLADGYIYFFQVVTAIQKLEPMVEYLHFSDQYTGPRQPEYVF